MDISPIISSLGYVLDEQAFRSKTIEEKARDFEKILIERIFIKSFIPDMKTSLFTSEDEKDSNLFARNDDQFQLQNALMRRLMADYLVKLDALGLSYLFNGDRKRGKT